MPLRWISFARVSMQRLGHLIAIATAASDMQATNAAGISRAYSELVRRRILVPDDSAPQVIDYLRTLRLWKRYGGRRGTLGVLGADPGKSLWVELQDLWLADSRLPSATGAVTDEVMDELPQLAASLQLVRPTNFTRTDRGRALAALGSEIFQRLSKGDLSANLFRLIGRTDTQASGEDRPGMAVFLLHALLEADGDFVRAAYSALLESPHDGFTRASFGELLPRACRRLAEELRRSPSIEDRHHASRLIAMAKHIEEKTPETQRTWGGGRPRDQAATVRIEPYVDLGLVTKGSRSAYGYRLKGHQRRFFEELATAPSVPDFLDTALIAGYLRGLAGKPEPIDEDEIWLRVRAAYDRLRSGLGYASLKEVVLLAIASLLDERRDRYFELRDGITVIRSQQQRDPRSVRLGVARTGEVTYMRLSR
jgi:hypothetical protein